MVQEINRNKVQNKWINGHFIPTYVDQSGYINLPGM